MQHMAKNEHLTLHHSKNVAGGNSGAWNSIPRYDTLPGNIVTPRFREVNRELCV